MKYPSEKPWDKPTELSEFAALAEDTAVVILDDWLRDAFKEYEKEYKEYAHFLRVRIIEQVRRQNDKSSV